MDNVATERRWTTTGQKRRVRGNRTCGSEVSFCSSFCIGADIPATAEYCAHVALILHGHSLGAGMHLQLWLADPQQERKPSRSDLGSSALRLAASSTAVTVLQRPSWHGFLTALQNPFGSVSLTTIDLGGKGKTRPTSVETTVLKTISFAYLFQVGGHTDTARQQAHEAPFW